MTLETSVTHMFLHSYSSDAKALRLSGGLQLELTLCDAVDAVVAGSSTSYEIQEMSLRCAVSKLDSALESSFAQMLMQNRALTLRMNTYHSQIQSLPAGNTDMSISLVRAFSRLNALFITFQGSSAADTPAPTFWDSIREALGLLADGDVRKAMKRDGKSSSQQISFQEPRNP